jgi:A/G-specific adenine glycosylase
MVKSIGVKVSLPPITPAPVWDALLAWYAQQGRDLPWRQTRDPYAILVSEIMLQQTQVDRVLPKYYAFLAAFPTFAELAAAPTDAVIRAWAPLGYNQRAVRLQAIARAVMNEHDGQMPNTLEGLLALPGIGRYTAGAIACFAHGQAVATVDTNIRRVLTRIFIGDLSAEAAATEKAEVALALAEAALPPEADHAYAWNQALMDLGATTCLARVPACERCPLTALCRTYAQMSEHTLFPSGTALRELQEAQRVAEATAPYTAKRPRAATQPFKESNRYFRGRVVDALRALPAGASLSLAALGPQVRPDYQDDEEAWLRRTVTGLVRDGLAQWADDAQTQVTLPR